MATQIPVTKGRSAVVDDESYAWLSQWRWHCSSSGYAVRMSPRPNRREIYMHRLILGLSPEDACEVDHINGDPLDNRRSNLRIVTHAQNLQNQRTTTGSSRYRGVYWSQQGRRPWKAKIAKDNQHYYLGSFSDEKQAARAYDQAAQEFFGPYARLNFPDDEQVGVE